MKKTPEPVVNAIHGESKIVKTKDKLIRREERGGIIIETVLHPDEGKPLPRNARI